MPIEFCFVPSDADPDVEIGNELVEPEQGILFENYASGQKEILGLECPRSDGRGSIKFFPLEGILKDVEVTEIPPDFDWNELPEPTAVINLGPGDTQEIDFNDGEGAQGSLRTRFIKGDSITDSGIIPKSLIHPN